MLRQAVVAQTTGTAFAEYENAGDATALGFDGRERPASAAAFWQGRKSYLLVVSPARHNLEVVTAAAVLLTAAEHS